MKFLQKKWLGISMALFAVMAAFAPAATRAADFDATDTTAILTTAVANVSPTLKYGIGALLLIGLGIWAVFFIVGKLKKHVK